MYTESEYVSVLFMKCINNLENIVSIARATLAKKKTVNNKSR